MVKILYLQSSDNLYGSDQSLLNLVTQLDRSKFEPIVVISNDIDDSGLLSQALEKIGVRVIKIKLAVLRRQYFSFKGILLFIYRLFTSVLYLAKLIRTEKIKIVHSNTTAVYSGAFAAWFTKTPHVWHVREIITKPILLQKFNSWLIPGLSTTIIANSERTRDNLVGQSSKKRIKTVVIYNGINLQQFDKAYGNGQQLRKSWNINEKTALIGMVGRISYRKGQDFFVKVAKEVLDEKLDAKFVIVGDTIPGKEEIKKELVAQIDHLNLNEKVIFEGFREDIPSVMDAFDIFVLPSRLPEAFGNVILEAMAMKKPVVANAHGGSTEIVEDGTTGYLVEPNNAALMTQKLASLIKDPEKREKMGLEGRRKVEEEFTLDKNKEAIVSLYKEILGEEII